MPDRRGIALIYEEYGNPDEVLQLQEFALPELRDGEVLIRMDAAAIHPSDLGMIGGSYGNLRGLPAIGGREGVGTVVEPGPGVGSDWEGKQVRLPGEGGAWTSHVVSRADVLSVVPSDIAAEQAALAAVNPPTAIRLLRDFADLQEGDWVVQNAGNSAVGIAVIQLARARGIKTASLVRREELVTPMKELGADLVVLDHRDAVGSIRDATAGARVPLGLNSIGGTSVLTVAQSLSDGGTVVTFGGMTGEKVRFPTRQLIFNDIRFCGFWLDRWNRKHGRVEAEALLNEAYEAIRQGVLFTNIEEMYPLNEYRKALEYNGSGRIGKILFSNG